jgi:hypothetical protein
MSNNVFKFRLVLIILIVIFSCPTAILNAQRSGGLQENLEAVADLERNYEKRLLWGERFFNLRFNSLALKQFEEAVKIKPSAYFPQYRISQIKLLLRQTNNSIFGELIFDFNKPGFLISMILFVILFSLTSMTLALVTVLFNRNKMVRSTANRNAREALPRCARSVASMAHRRRPEAASVVRRSTAPRTAVKPTSEAEPRRGGPAR